MDGQIKFLLQDFIRGSDRRKIAREADGVNEQLKTVDTFPQRGNITHVLRIYERPYADFHNNARQ